MSKLTLRNAVEQYEKAILQEILRKAGGNYSNAAKMAGIDRKSFYNKLGSKKDIGPSWITNDKNVFIVNEAADLISGSQQPVETIHAYSYA